MKTLFRCDKCYSYSLIKQLCKNCGTGMKYPYPARFSIIKEKRYRKYIKP